MPATTPLLKFIRRVRTVPTIAQTTYALESLASQCNLEKSVRVYTSCLAGAIAEAIKRGWFDEFVFPIVLALRADAPASMCQVGAYHTLFKHLTLSDHGDQMFDLVLLACLVPFEGDGAGAASVPELLKNLLANSDVKAYLNQPQLDIRRAIVDHIFDQLHQNMHIHAIRHHIVRVLRWMARQPDWAVLGPGGLNMLKLAPLSTDPSLISEMMDNLAKHGNVPSVMKAIVGDGNAPIAYQHMRLLNEMVRHAKLYDEYGARIVTEQLALRIVKNMRYDDNQEDAEAQWYAFVSGFLTKFRYIQDGDGEWLYSPNTTEHLHPSTPAVRLFIAYVERELWPMYYVSRGAVGEEEEAKKKEEDPAELDPEEEEAKMEMDAPAPVPPPALAPPPLIRKRRQEEEEDEEIDELAQDLAAMRYKRWKPTIMPSSSPSPTHQFSGIFAGRSIRALPEEEEEEDEEESRFKRAKPSSSQRMQLCM